MTNADAAHKITRAHHSRKAVVYLRQASLAQVKRNTESQRLQYALADTATRSPSTRCMNRWGWQSTFCTTRGRST